jgi:hypothetical protein
VLVLQYERCASDPAGQLESTYRFLGLDEYEPVHLHRPVNRSGGKLQLDDDTIRRLVDVYAADVQELAAMVPSIDLSQWPHFDSLDR